MKKLLTCLALSILGACAGLDIRGSLSYEGNSITVGRDGKRTVVDINLDGKQVISR